MQEAIEDEAAHKILFVCTGNIFRSMVAEYALKQNLVENAGLIIESAGTKAEPQPVHAAVQEELKGRGIDVSGHRQRRITAELLREADLVIAMSTDHRDFLREEFKHEAVLFWQLCTGEEKPFLDVDEAVPDYKTNHNAAYEYARQAVQTIFNNIGKLQDELHAFLPRAPRPCKTSL